jgi:hypothetical protein
MTVHGVPPSKIKEWIILHRLSGFDRVVPIGHALDMGIVWDGFDLVESLSRIIEVQCSGGL